MSFSVSVSQCLLHFVFLSFLSLYSLSVSPFLSFSLSLAISLCFYLSLYLSLARVCAHSLSHSLSFTLCLSLRVSLCFYFAPLLSLNFASLFLLLLPARCLLVLSLSRAQFCARFLFQSYALIYLKLFLSLVLFGCLSRNTTKSNPHGCELHRPSMKSTILPFKVTNAIIVISLVRAFLSSFSSLALSRAPSLFSCLCLAGCDWLGALICVQ